MNSIMNASKIDDDEILICLMQSLIDIGRVNYDYIVDYI